MLHFSSSVAQPPHLLPQFARTCARRPPSEPTPNLGTRFMLSLGAVRMMAVLACTALLSSAFIPQPLPSDTLREIVLTVCFD